MTIHKLILHDDGARFICESKEDYLAKMQLIAALEWAKQPFLLLLPEKWRVTVTVTIDQADDKV